MSCFGKLEFGTMFVCACLRCTFVAWCLYPKQVVSLVSRSRAFKWKDSSAACFTLVWVSCSGWSNLISVWVKGSYSPSSPTGPRIACGSSLQQGRSPSTSPDTSSIHRTPVDKREHHNGSTERTVVFVLFKKGEVGSVDPPDPYVRFHLY